MRTTILLLFISTIAFSQKTKPIKSKLFFQGKEVMIDNPPNVRQLYDSIFIDETEMSNINWLEYLYSIQKDSSVRFHQSQLPDTLAFVNISTKSNPAFTTYLNHPAYRYYPVINVSYEQAQNYCKWRTDVVNGILKMNEQKNQKPYKLQVEYRLPTQKEWEYAALGGLDVEKYPNGILEKYKKLNKKDLDREIYEPANECEDSLLTSYKKSSKILEYNANVKEDYFIPESNTIIDCDDFYAVSTSYTNHYSPNQFGLYDMIGNVSEMVLEKGIAKGGSYRNSYDLINIKKNYYYDSPKDWLGFRCVCVVHLKKK